MVRQGFEAALDALKNDLLKMGGMVEECVVLSVKSLADSDVELAKQVIIGDEKINDLEHKIKEEAIHLIATQQPVAKDLRKIMAAIDIATDLERMADLGLDIAKVTVRLENQQLIKPLVDIPRMAEVTKEMIHESLDAYVNEDVEAAERVGLKDDEVDKTYSQIIRELLTYMMENPQTINQATLLMFVGRYLERIADHATNIGEAVVFLKTNRRPDLNK